MSEIDKVKRGLDIQAMMSHPGWTWLSTHLARRIELQKDYLVSDTCWKAGEGDKVRGGIQELQSLSNLMSAWIRDGLKEHERETQREA